MPASSTMTDLLLPSSEPFRLRHEVAAGRFDEDSDVGVVGMEPQRRCGPAQGVGGTGRHTHHRVQGEDLQHRGAELGGGVQVLGRAQVVLDREPQLSVLERHAGCRGHVGAGRGAVDGAPCEQERAERLGVGGEPGEVAFGRERPGAERAALDPVVLDLRYVDASRAVRRPPGLGAQFDVAHPATGARGFGLDPDPLIGELPGSQSDRTDRCGQPATARGSRGAAVGPDRRRSERRARDDRGGDAQTHDRGADPAPAVVAAPPIPYVIQIERRRRRPVPCLFQETLRVIHRRLRSVLKGSRVRGRRAHGR